MMFKIILIDPPGWQGAANNQRAYPNVGLAYLASALQKNNFEVAVIDLNNQNLNPEQVMTIIRRESPSVVGFSAKTATVTACEQIAGEIKKAFSQLPLIIGGPHATLSWPELLATNLFAAIMLGEGEENISSLSRALINKQKDIRLDGIVTPELSANGVEFAPTLIKNLDSLSFPNYKLFPINVQNFIRQAYPLSTSRGCVYNCIYCSVPLVSGRRFRARSPQNVIEELLQAVERYQIKGFEIIDDNFNLDIKRAKEICRLLISNNLKLRWSCPNGLRADRVDQELANLMFRAGCGSVNVGVESGDPDVFNNIQKGETLDQIKNGIKIFQREKIQVTGFFIIGLPFDSIKAQKKSFALIHELNINALFSMLVPYPKTALWDWVHKNDLLIGDPRDALHFSDQKDKINIIFETKDFSKEEKKLVYEMVNTKLGCFGLLIPRNNSALQYIKKVFYLIWKYNRLSIRDNFFLFKILVNKIKCKLKFNYYGQRR